MYNSDQLSGYEGTNIEITGQLVTLYHRQLSCKSKTHDSIESHTMSSFCDTS